MIFLWRWLLNLPFIVRLSLCVVVIVFWAYVCLAPSSDEPAWIEINDKVAHFVGNFGITGVIYIAAVCRRWWSLAGIVLSYALGIEVIQSFIPSRFFSLWDMVANTGGVVTAIVLMQWLERRKQSSENWF